MKENEGLQWLNAVQERIDTKEDLLLAEDLFISKQMVDILQPCELRDWHLARYIYLIDYFNGDINE